MNQYVCIHGHFYQPPRENPWLEFVELQDSAAPYHDWNDRISAECYEPNTASRILDEDKRIVSIVNNFSRISFNFGPTLLAWLEQARRGVYRAILEADRQSMERFGGHGSALAQVYNHVILPLATEEEKALQVRWGIADFEKRFGRRPEGMWLSETAVDTESLEALAAEGIGFTILSPWQAARVRPLAGGRWRDVSGGRVDPRRAYQQNLPSGRTIALFFYDGPASQAVAFEGILHRSEQFANRLLDLIPRPPATNAEPRLAHIATDGESYGHHHPHGDMALAAALHKIEDSSHATLTNYAQFLERHPPELEVQILEKSSWSCAHGVERWRSDCGCRTGGDRNWTQGWRAPLRNALDSLRARLLEASQPSEAEIFRNPAEALASYINVIVDRTPEARQRFLDEQLADATSAATAIRASKLMELRRQLQLMYTSCGWFFTDLGGIETVQILRYAGRAVQLGEDLFDSNFEEDFLLQLDLAHSNVTQVGSGRDVYQRHVLPSKVTWEMVTAHYAITSLFEDTADVASIYCYDVARSAHETLNSDNMRLALGRTTLTSQIVGASEALSYAVAQSGEHDVTVGVSRNGARQHEELTKALRDLFHSGDPDAMLEGLKEIFGEHVYGLRSLFADEQRRVVDRLLQSTLREAEAAHRRLYEKQEPTIRFLAELDVPPPPSLAVAAHLVTNSNLRQELASDDADSARVGDLLRHAVLEGIRLDDARLAFAAGQSTAALAQWFFEAPEELELLEKLAAKVRLVLTLPFEVELWKVQNLYFRALTDVFPRQNERSRTNATARRWVETFLSLGKDLSMKLPADA